MKVELTACDRDGEIPALTYEIKVSDGREIKIDLCTRHAAKIEELIEELLEEGGPQAEDEPVPDSAPEPEQVEEASVTTSTPAKRAPTKKAPDKKAPAKKTATKKTAAKKTAAAKTAAGKTTSSRRRPRVTTLEEIEAQKQQG